MKYSTFIDRENYDLQFCEVNDAGEEDKEKHLQAEVARFHFQLNVDE